MVLAAFSLLLDPADPGHFLLRMLRELAFRILVNHWVIGLIRLRGDEVALQMSSLASKGQSLDLNTGVRGEF